MTERFRLIVDASTLRSGGGPIIAAHELEMIHRTFGSAVELLLVDGPNGLPLSPDVVVRRLSRPSIDPGSPAGFLRWSFVEAPRLVREEKADAYLSFVNWLPLRMTVPSAVYLHSPYAMRLAVGRPRDLPERLPRYVVAQLGLAAAKAVVVQTEMIRRDVLSALARIRPLAPHSEKLPILKITPTGSWMKRKIADPRLMVELQSLRTRADFWLFYPSIPWTHKNMDGLARALNHVASSGICIGLLLPAGGITAAQLESGPHRPELRTFDGLTQDEMAACYDFADGVIFPSLLETAGLGLVEALARRRPLLASNRDFTHELAGDAALLFDPEAPADMAARIIEFARDADRQAKGRERAERWIASQQARTETGWRSVFELLGAGER